MSGSSIHKINEFIAEEFRSKAALSDEIQRENKMSNNFKFNSICKDMDDIYKVEGLPLELEKGHLYLIISWDTNYRIEGLDYNKFKVDDRRGPELSCTSEYILVYQP